MSANNVRFATMIFVLIDGLKPAVRMIALYCSQLLADACAFTWLTTAFQIFGWTAVQIAASSAGNTTSGISMSEGSIFYFSSHRI
jgi:hypothetical protein